MKKTVEFYLKIEASVCVAAFIIMIAMCIFQVLNRNILRLSIGWTEEIARYSMVWMALLGSAIGLREGKQMSVEFFYNKLPGTARKWVNVIGDLICIAFSGTAGVYAIVQMQLYLSAGQSSPALRLPTGIVFSIIPASLLVMTVSQAWQLYKHAAEFRGGASGKEVKA